jgi:hypothetical protein
MTPDVPMPTTWYEYQEQKQRDEERRLAEADAQEAPRKGLPPLCKEHSFTIEVCDVGRSV